MAQLSKFAEGVWDGVKNPKLIAALLFAAAVGKYGLSLGRAEDQKRRRSSLGGSGQSAAIKEKVNVDSKVGWLLFRFKRFTFAFCACCVVVVFLLLIPFG